MHRRTFLKALSAMALARVVSSTSLPRDVRITRAVAFDLSCRRLKVAGKNAQLDVHGDRASDRMLRLYTNAGIEALGNCSAERRR
jgi:hypothetical protein